MFLIDYNRHALGLRRSVIGHDRHRAGHCRPRPPTIPIVLLNKLVRCIRARLYGNHLVRVGADATSAVSSRGGTRAEMAPPASVPAIGHVANNTRLAAGPAKRTVAVDERVGRLFSAEHRLVLGHHRHTGSSASASGEPTATTVSPPTSVDTVANAVVAAADEGKDTAGTMDACGARLLASP